MSPEFALDLEYSQLEPDNRMKDTFEASLDRHNPTIHGAEWRAIDSHSAVAYVLSPPIKKAESESISATALLLVAELLKAGGVVAKSESAGLAYGRDRWLELALQHRKAIKDGDATSESHSGNSEYSGKICGLVQETDLTWNLLVATMCKTTSESS